MLSSDGEKVAHATSRTASRHSAQLYDPPFAGTVEPRGLRLGQYSELIPFLESLSSFLLESSRGRWNPDRIRTP
jgi:hypothetical protein